jgi:uncharacterized integral membrane protein
MGTRDSADESRRPHPKSKKGRRQKMKVSQVIGGIICLLLAILLAVLAVTLPADKMMFMVNGKNMPYVPAIGLAIVGLGLIVTSWRR